jgi:uncharacterized protein (TIGR02466 family)
MNGTIHNIWSVPIWSSFIKQDYTWLDAAKKIEYERMYSDNGDITINKNILELPEFSTLKNHIVEEFKKYVYGYLSIKKEINFKFLNSWIVKHKKGDSAQSHLHANSMFSGTYYLLHKPKMGNINFLKENSVNNIGFSNIMFDYENFNAVNCQSYTVDCKQDLVIFFPSHIKHSVEKNELDLHRYSIAFNIWPVGRFGNKEYQLELK